MGRNLPSENNAALAWLEGHIDQWQANPASMGLTQAQADDLAAEIVTARTRRAAADEARFAALAATQSYNAAGDAMRSTAGELIAIIKAFAQSGQNASSVYVAAGLTAARSRGPLPAPTIPVVTSCTMRATGDVALAFDATGPAGTVYTVSRKLDTETGYRLLGFASGNDKSFVDTALPAGSASATYVVQGIRGEKKGASSAPTTLSLGNPASTTSRAAA
jgi:hypothetical protein